MLFDEQTEWGLICHTTDSSASYMYRAISNPHIEAHEVYLTTPPPVKRIPVTESH